MRLFSWLRNRRQHGFPRQRPTFRPTLEALEHRWVPSTLTVTSIADKGTGSLRGDIAAAQSGDTINFAPSLDGQTITLKSELLINKNLTITGPIDRSVTVSGNKVSRVFEVAQGMQVTLSGLTIKSGLAQNGNGGGILVDAGAVLTASNSTLSSNSAIWSLNGMGGHGGGIYNLGTATVSNCTLTNNSAIGNAGGGGICNQGTLTVNNNSVVSGNIDAGIANTGTATISGSTLSGNSASGIKNLLPGTVTVRDSILSDNSASQGGGLWNNGTATLNNCTLSGNSATDSGGGIWSTGNSSISGSGKLTVSGCALSGNYCITTSRTGYGGGIAIEGGTAMISACTLSDNSTPGFGGGIYIYGSEATLTISGSTLSGNSATGGPFSGGGGIYSFGGATVYLDSFTVANTINNTDSSGLNGPTANIDGSYTLI